MRSSSRTKQGAYSLSAPSSRSRPLLYGSHPEPVAPFLTQIRFGPQLVFNRVNSVEQLPVLQTRLPCSGGGAEDNLRTVNAFGYFSVLRIGAPLTLSYMRVPILIRLTQKSASQAMLDLRSASSVLPQKKINGPVLIVNDLPFLTNRWESNWDLSNTGL
ncbi:hypothetical protein GW7_09209 [Heterocephalus glaber]|uniref:Uncharacterized protein n=1 Tax=Heterocephalus glaber TaxID=10181 RepID=G5AY75_HETGA|nr:hypothetical protein GW7_09209 [Heterocephalus glaber]